ncbi:hypothetical protein [Microbacterium maritypicum]|uniref:hypothetical protein n=1 Tax=Microbacterium maritypicum TaxID=33918 RepID=UPI00296FA7BE|nr:hypothetical protein [Microbacterium liquefaciens]
MTPDLFCAYVYGVIAHPAYVANFYDELENAELIWLHTYGTRMFKSTDEYTHIPPGICKCTAAVSEHPEKYPTFYKYDPDFEPLSADVWNFAISISV